MTPSNCRPVRYSGFFTLLAQAPRADLVLLLSATIGGALTEGVGVVMLVPLLAGLSGGGFGQGRMARVFAQAGLPLNLTAILTLYVMLVALRTWLVHAQRLRAAALEHKIVDELRIKAFASIIRANWRWLAQTKASDHANLIITNVSRVGFGLSQMLNMSAMMVVGGVYLGVALLISWPMAVMTIGGGALVLALFAGMRRRAAILGEATGLAHRALHGLVHQGLAGVRLIKIHGVQTERVEAFERTLADVRKRQAHYEHISSASQSILQLGGAAVLALILSLGIWVWHVTLPVLLPIIFIFSRALPMLGAIQQCWTQWLHARPALDEIDTLLRDAGAQCEYDQNLQVPTLTARQAISLEDVSLRYAGRDRPALDRVTLTLVANSTTAVSGASGAGKSTLADVLMGLIDIEAGVMRIDGVALDDAGRIHWRRSVAYVQQEPFLFHDTIRNNLTIGRLNVGEHDMRQALTRAAANFVHDLPDGLETVVGDGGVRLLGGERQRIGLARALIGRPSLLILDEVTSSLDPASETVVRRRSRPWMGHSRS